MGTNIRVVNPNGNSVSINRQGTQRNIRTVVVPAATSGSGATQFSQLTDVDATGAANNEVVVYNDQTNKYEVRDITLVDGGTF